MPQFIYTMKGLGKVHPPDTRVLEDIWLSFYFGAKIGVLGLNGAGKSSLLRIMAGEDTIVHRRSVSGGRASRSGSSSRSRGSTPTKTVLGNVEEGVAPIKALLDALRRGQRQARRGPLARGDGQGPRGAVEDPGQDRRLERLGPRLAARAGDGRAAAAAARCRRHDAVGRRAPPRGAVPAAAAVARPAAARRADQPSRRRVGGVARAVPQGLSGHGRRRDPRSLLPRQRRRLDSRARSRPRHSVGRELLVLARAEAAAAAARGEGRDAAAADARARARMDPDVAARAAGQGQGASERLRRAAARRHGAEDRDGGDLHRARSAARRRRRRSAAPPQGLRRQPADRGPELHAAARRHRRRHRSERRRQDDAVPHDHRGRSSRTPAR